MAIYYTVSGEKKSAALTTRESNEDKQRVFPHSVTAVLREWKRSDSGTEEGNVFAQADHNTREVSFMMEPRGMMCVLSFDKIEDMSIQDVARHVRSFPPPE